MAEKKQPAIKFTTPLAAFKYPHLTEVDYGTKDFPNPTGSYNVAQIFEFDNQAVQAMIEKLKPLHDEAISAGKKAFSELKIDVRKKLKDITVNPLFTTLYDKDTEEETGQIEFRFKMGASGTRKDNTTWTQKPDLFDASGAPLPKKGVKVWGGSVGKVSFIASPYFIPATGACGLALKLKAAQITKLSSGEKTADSYGFGQEEGFSAAEHVADEDDSTTSPATASDTADVGGDDGASGDF